MIKKTGIFLLLALSMASCGDDDDDTTTPRGGAGGAEAGAGGDTASEGGTSSGAGGTDTAGGDAGGDAGVAGSYAGGDVGGGAGVAGGAGAGAGAVAGGGAGGDDAGGSGGAGGDGSLAALIERGQYVVDVLAACGDCHTPRLESGAPDTSKYLSGAENFAAAGEQGALGVLHSRNLTNHETGLANWSDEDIERAIRDGVRPNGDALHNVMPYYVFHNISDADIAAIIAYLRTVPGVNHSVPASTGIFLLDDPVNPVDVTTFPVPANDYPERDSALRGRYIAAEIGICVECHTPHQQGADVLLPANYFKGGESFSIGIPVPIVSKNLTSDAATGLGTWTVADIVKALKEGKDKADDGICPPMPVGPMGAFGQLTDEDALDIAHYIKSLPAIDNAVADQCTWPLPPPP